METNGNLAVDPSAKVDMFKSFTGPPEWMDREYIHQVLKESEKDTSLKLSDYQIVSATKPGDNFASIALRLKASFTTKGKESTKSYIVKVEPYQEGLQKDALLCRPLFETEISMYAKTIPEMQRIIKEINPDEVIAPPVAYSSLNPHKIIFIEDISPEFVMSQKALSFEEASEVFGKIAKFHALSFFMGEAHAPMKSYVEGFISVNTQPMMGFMMQNLKGFIETIGEWGPEMEMVAEKLEQLKPTFFDKLLRVFERNQKTGYNVLNHGDFHIKNIMFRNQRDFPNSSDQTRLIDFQLCIWASPAIDLNFALYGLVGSEARKRREELIRHYYEVFTRTLKKLGYLTAPPSLLDLQIELLRNGLLEVFLVSLLMPMLHMDGSKIAELGDAGEMTVEKMVELQKATYNHPDMKVQLMELMPHLMYKGILEA